MKPDMPELIRTFPDQMRQAVQLAQEAELSSPTPVSQVLVAGMGGSGIGSGVAASLALPPVPMSTWSDYELPSWAGPGTLLIASSYSGNTEETLDAVEQAKDRGCRIAAVCSGGSLAEQARAAGWDLLIVPGGRPPRSTLAFSVAMQLRLLHHFGLAPDPAAPLLRCADYLEAHQPELRAQAAQLAAQLPGTTPVLYGARAWEPVLRRWCQQIQENAKMLCWMHVLPELNHNELVGWRDQRPDLSALFFHSSLDHPRTAHRSRFTRQVVQDCGARVLDLAAQGADRWEQVFAWIHLGDWLSVELAALRGVDPVEIAVIDRLKDELPRVP
jgi:glucose/mannose-6-phosphate isomerase